MTEPRRTYKSSKATTWTIDVDGEVFTVGNLPGFLYMDLLRLSGGGGTNYDVTLKTHECFEAAMDEEEFERFHSFCSASDGPDLETLGEILNDLAEDSAKRPTQPSSTSRGGRRNAANGSVGKSSAEASTPKV